MSQSDHRLKGIGAESLARYMKRQGDNPSQLFTATSESAEKVTASAEPASHPNRKREKKHGQRPPVRRSH